MKNLLLLLLCSSLAFAASAQSLINRNPTEALVRKVTTTNATATRADLIPVATNEVGTITIKVVGIDTVTAAAITGTKTYRYTEVAGTLTLGTVIQDLADTTVVDAGISGAAFDATASSGGILVRVTGKASTTIYWKVIVKQTAIYKE